MVTLNISPKVYEDVQEELRSFDWWDLDDISRGPFTWNRELASQVLKHVAAEPDTYVQESWVTLADHVALRADVHNFSDATPLSDIPARDVCASTACLAGWVTTLGQGTNLGSLYRDVVGDVPFQARSGVMNVWGRKIWQNAHRLLFPQLVTTLTGEYDELGEFGLIKNSPIAWLQQCVFTVMRPTEAVTRFAAFFNLDSRTGELR